MRRFLKIVAASAALLVLADCSLAPRMKKVLSELPTHFKEAPKKEEKKPNTPIPLVASKEEKQWKKAEPAEDKYRGRWWEVFNDKELNALEKQAEEANQSLKAAGARVQQSRAVARMARAELWPHARVNGSSLRQTPSSVSMGVPGEEPSPRNLYHAGGDITYEIDLFARLLDTTRAAVFDAKAEQATYRSVLLALQADVAEHYFSLRTLDAERKTLEDTVVLKTNAEQRVKRRLDAGYSSAIDYAGAQTELANVKAEKIALDRTRANVEHALAVLLGKAPAEFTMAIAPLEGTVPDIPAGLPSELLERRPDIVAAQKRLQAANSRIGVARAAFFPRLLLTANGGVESLELKDLFKWTSRTWAVGPSVALPLFEGGLNFANLRGANAAYEEAVANYRQEVLIAFRDVEDGLASVHFLTLEAKEREQAVASTSHSATLFQARYQQGDADYLDIVRVERDQLAAKRAAVQLKGQQFLATIALIRALGGGWTE